MASVNRPTNTAMKEKDVNQKLQLYGIYSAFALGKAPSNKQIDIAMNSALASTALSQPSSKLSEEGRQLVADLNDVIRQAQHLLLSKNEGNLLQDFIWQTQNIDGSNAQKPGAPVDKATAKQHGNEALDGLRTLGTLIISNGQFRKLLNDAVILLRDIAGDAAAKTARKVNPSEEQLSQIDKPADDNTWHDVPDTGNLKAQMKDHYQNVKPFNRQNVKDAVSDAAKSANDHPGDNQESVQVGATQLKENLLSKADENVPDEKQEQVSEQTEQAKQKAKEAKEAAKQRTKSYLSNKMPQERREQTIWRLKKMIVEIQGHSDYQQAIETLLSLAEQYGGHASNLTSQGAGTVKGARANENLQAAETDIKTLIERFANSTSSEDLFESLNNIYKDADSDPELKGWFTSVDKFIRKCLQEQGYVLKDESTQEYNALYEKGQFLLRERYRDHTNRILDEVKFMGDQFDQDPQNTAFANSLNKLFNDLGKNEDGKATFKPHLVKDLTQVIIPGIFENIRYVPIPRIEISDPMIDAIVENLIIESDNLFPNVLEFGSDNYFRLGRRSIANRNEHKTMIAGSGIQMDLRDVAYYVKKKQGFPSLTDKGVMDIFLGGEGFNFKIIARNAQKEDRHHFVVVESVKVNVKNLKIKIKQSNHKLLFTVAKSLLLKVMRPVIEKAIQTVIKKKFEEADAYAWSIYQDVQKSAKLAKDDPEQAQNIYQQYVSAIQKRMTEAKKKAQETASDTKVNVAVTKHDSIFQNISLPGGISTKATEYKELAAKGDNWESPVFSIGSASQSTKIPKMEPVTRKPHSTAMGQVRGGNHPGPARVSSGAGQILQTNGNSNVYTSNMSSGMTNGFQNQVDKAFENKAYDAPTNGIGQANYSNGITTH